MEISITKAEHLKPLPDESSLSFGTLFTDHMFNMDYNPDYGWYNPRIEPYQPIVMDPATMVLHYGQAIFEGLKAYRSAEDEILLFRPQENMARLNRSARRMCIPEIDEEQVLSALMQLLRIESRWVPSAVGTSLYIRPIIIATDPFLGLGVSNTYRFFIILSPVGAYYKEGFDPVRIWVTEKYVRAVPGGVGEVKTAGNYAASLYASREAKENGYTQVLWLDGVERKYIEEVGAMNIFFVIDGRIVTPRLSGSILPGITRDSVIQLAKSLGAPVEERRISIDEVLEAHASGRLEEVFGSGTAAVISPVGEIRFKNKSMIIADGKVGPWARRFFDALTDIQYGRKPGPDGWVVPVNG